MQVQIPQVTLEDTKGFAEAWNKSRPIVVIFDPHDLAFAQAFANFAVQRVFAGLIAQQEAEAKRLTVVEP
jgi:hypothetical protein